MNDVLPKPFTKEGLLNMLEKHLGHLKKIPDGMEGLPPPSAVSLTHGSGAQSLKDDQSPAQSPSTISNWQSPSQFAGMSPVTAPPSQFMSPMQPPSGYAMDPSPLQYQSPQNPFAARPLQHRRGVSEMQSSEDITHEAKRQRMLEQSNPMSLGQNPRLRPG